MPTFDPSVWMLRAARRLERAIKEKRTTGAACFMRDSVSIERLEILIDWCKSKRLDVAFGRIPNGVYEHDKRLITINGSLTPENQLFVLMHECGHHLIGQPNPDDRYGSGHHVRDPEVKKTIVHRVDVIDEELEAWARGLKLTKRLGMTIDLDRYNRTRSEYIKTYLKWALKVEGYGGDLDNG